MSDASAQELTKKISGYEDLAGVPEREIFLGRASSLGEAVTSPSQFTNSPPFPVKLFVMLETMEREGSFHVASWQSHGRCFKIHDKKKFVSEILPRFFRQNQYTSFQRQLNLYDFHRLSAGPDKGAYYHQRFLRFRPNLAYTVTRIKVKGDGPRKAGVPQLEPKFHEMEPVRPQQQQGVVSSSSSRNQQIPYHQKITGESKSTEQYATPVTQQSVVSTEPMEDDDIQQSMNDDSVAQGEEGSTRRAVVLPTTCGSPAAETARPTTTPMAPWHLLQLRASQLPPPNIINKNVGSTPASLPLVYTMTTPETNSPADILPFSACTMPFPLRAVIKPGSGRTNNTGGGSSGLDNNDTSHGGRVIKALYAGASGSSSLSLTTILIQGSKQSSASTTVAPT